MSTNDQKTFLPFFKKKAIRFMSCFAMHRIQCQKDFRSWNLNLRSISRQARTEKLGEDATSSFRTMFALEFPVGFHWKVNRSRDKIANWLNCKFREQLYMYIQLRSCNTNENRIRAEVGEKTEKFWKIRRFSKNSNRIELQKKFQHSRPFKMARSVAFAPFFEPIYLKYWT